MLGAILAGGLLPGCASDAGGGAADVPAVATSPGTVALVDPASFAVTIEDQDMTTLDVRTPQEFAAGHIEGAVNIDVQDPATFPAQVAELDPTASYAVYCRSGNRSATATQFMIDEGFSSVLELDGGILAWQRNGFPVVQ